MIILIRKISSTTIVMSDSESDGEDIQKIEHVTGPVEDAWKMKIPEFKEEDNKNGLFLL